MKIGILSDTHGYLDKKIFDYFSDCDEIWHAGDIGDMTVANQLADFKPLRAVYGNVDGLQIRQIFPEELLFELAGMKIYMIHIGGRPGRYAKGVKSRLKQINPDIFVTGHSHILRIEKDTNLGGLLYMNPGAAGKQGLHKIKTLIRFDIVDKQAKNIQVIELGKRGSIQ